MKRSAVDPQEVRSAVAALRPQQGPQQPPHTPQGAALRVQPGSAVRSPGSAVREPFGLEASGTADHGQRPQGTPVVGAYLRVSSRAQDAASQRAAIERAAVARGDNIAVWYSEKRSGKALARPELDRVRGDVRAGTLRRLFIYRLDRLTRSGIRDTLDVLEELRTNGCDIVTVSDGFDLGGPYAEVIIAVMSWAAQMERLAINERISAARDRLEAEGRAWGRPARLTGLELEQAKALRSDGRSIREIAIAMKVPRSTVARAVSQKGGVRDQGPSKGDTAVSAPQQGPSQSCTSETAPVRPGGSRR